LCCLLATALEIYAEPLITTRQVVMYSVWFCGKHQLAIDCDEVMKYCDGSGARQSGEKSSDAVATVGFHCYR
jgi:hypothetical protein